MLQYSTAALQLKKTLMWSLYLANIVIIIAFWLSNASPQLLSPEPGLAINAIGRLMGLLTAYSVLVQFVLMGRIGWLEPIFGMDKLAIFHRRNGMALIVLLIGHISLMLTSNSILMGQAPPAVLQTLLALPGVPLALIAAVLYITIVGLTIYIVRRHLRFETWYFIHLFVYLATFLAAFHQFFIGSDLAEGAFRYYWLALYIFIIANIIVWRFARPIWRFIFFRFKVEKVVPETPTATSVYITGKNLQKFKMYGGQFVLVRFLDRKRIWQEHPFSLSMVANEDHLRLTIRQLGDFTNSVPQIKPGTPVIVSGPYGSFRHNKQITDKVLYIAGGIGITPIHSLVEERASAGNKGDAVLLYGNRTLKDTALWSELQSLALKMNMELVNVLSEQPDYKGEKGYIDKEKIGHLVPDVAQRDVFLCGPPPMMAGIVKALKELGVSGNQVHYERFSLHKQ